MQQSGAGGYQQLTFDGKPEWWYSIVDPEVRSAVARASFQPHRAPAVTCEPCQQGGGPTDCVRPCVTYSTSRSERLYDHSEHNDQEHA